VNGEGEVRSKRCLKLPTLSEMFETADIVRDAVLLSAFAFALVWPIYDSMSGFLLGIATALLYRRFRNVFPAIVANAVLTIACAATLIYQRLY
jgi:hypothetical protein